MQKELPLTFVLSDGTEISSHRHINPDGKVGGWVSDRAVVPSEATVEFGAIVGPGIRLSKGAVVKRGEILANIEGVQGAK